MAQVKTLCNVAWKAPDKIAQENHIQYCLNTLLMGQHSTGKALYNVVPEAQDKIGQEKI